MLRSATCSTNPESSRLICESSVVNPLFEDSGGRASQGGRHVDLQKGVHLDAPNAPPGLPNAPLGVPKWSSEANDELTMGVFPVVNCQLTIFAASRAAVAPRRVDCQLGKKIVNWPPCSIEPMKTKLFCKSQNVQGRTKMEPRETPLDTVRWPCGSTWLCQVAESGPKPNPKSQIVVPWFPKCNQRLTKKDHELQKFPKMQPKVPKIEAGGGWI